MEVNHTHKMTLLVFFTLICSGFKWKVGMTHSQKGDNYETKTNTGMYLSMLWLVRRTQSYVFSSLKVAIQTILSKPPSHKYS